MPKVWSLPYSPSSLTSLGSLLHTSPIPGIRHLHSATPPCLENSASCLSPTFRTQQQASSCNFNEFLFSVRNKSSTYNRSITGIPPSTLKQRLESFLLLISPKENKLSIKSYHVEPHDLLQSLPLKRSTILPMSLILYVLKHYVSE